MGMDEQEGGVDQKLSQAKEDIIIKILYQVVTLSMASSTKHGMIMIFGWLES